MTVHSCSKCECGLWKTVLWPNSVEYNLFSESNKT